MSRSYKQELELVQKEYEAANFALSHIVVFWNTAVIINEAQGRSREDFRRAVVHLEVTYIIRLFATFEGFLKQYLATHHKEVKLPRQPEKMKVGWFIDRVALLQSPHISENLKNGIYDVRACRNDLMHSGRAVSPIISFEDARTNLAKYLDKLPHPL